MQDCIEGLFKFLGFKSNQKLFKEYINRTKCLKGVQGDSDEVIKKIYENCTAYSAQYVVNSYRTSLFSSYKFETININVNIFSTINSYTISDSDSLSPKCTCLSSANMLLPCKHIFFLNRINDKSIFNPEMIPFRWSKAHQALKSYQID